MKIIIFLILIFPGIQIAFAQKEGKAKIDSITSELLKAKEDTNKVKILASLCYELRNINPREALKPGLDALRLAEKLNYQAGKGEAHYSLVFIYHFLSRLPESVEHALKAETIFENLGNNNQLCATYLILAYLYKDLDKGISAGYMQKATDLLPFNRDILSRARNIGMLGNNYRNLRQFDSALKYMNLHLKMSEEFGLKGEIMVEKNRFGYLFMIQSKLDTAFTLIKTGLEYFQSIGSTRMVAENSTTLGRIRLLQSKENGLLSHQYLKEAETYAKQGVQVSSGLGYLIQRYAANRLLSDIYRAEGKNDLALEYLEAAFNDYDSVYGSQTVSKASVLSWRNEEELRDKQVELLELRNRQQLAIIFGAVFGIVILVIIVLIIINKRRSLKKAYLLVNTQKEEISRVLGELESSNHELEAFSYSVSHDLLAPVRRIEGLCNFLKEDYEIVLDDKGKELLKHLITSTAMMNRLIEDLLKLSRITLQTITKTSCNISEMAAKICDDLKLTYTENPVTCRIEENMIVQADFRLLQIVFQNLIDNAWKYSSKTKNPELTIGSEIKENKRVIFIRDNGVGFDMSKAGNLFTPFHRLHSSEQFKGTGIGLATVKRIIIKHGGAITAQSEPGKGTTFSFTL